MVKLIFTAYKTTDKFFFIIIFAIYKSCTRILSKKTMKDFLKILAESTKIFLKKKKIKGAKMLMSKIEKEEKKRRKEASIYIIVNIIYRERYKNEIF